MKDLTETTFRPARFIALALGLTVGAVACSDAQSSESPDGESAIDAPEAVVEVQHAIPSGTSMTFYVDQEISTDSHAAGDRFIATLQVPVHDADGEIALDTGSASQWVVTQATVEGGQALLAVELESIDTHGAWAPVRATVTELDLDTDNPDSGGETAAKIGVGAAAGALVGQILGKDTESTLKGAGVGAAVGTAVALATRGGSAKLPAGSALTVRLDEPLTIS